MGGVSPLKWKIREGGGSNWKKPSVGGGGGMDVFWNHTFDKHYSIDVVNFFDSFNYKFNKPIRVQNKN